MRDLRKLLSNTVTREIRIELRFGDCSGVTLTIDRRSLRNLARRCDKLVKGVELDLTYKSMMLGDLYVVSFNKEDEAFVRNVLAQKPERPQRPQRTRRR